MFEVMMEDLEQVFEGIPSVLIVFPDIPSVDVATFSKCFQS